MFDFAWSELGLIAVVAMILIGPKDMPVAIRSVTAWIRKARRMAAEFQTHVDEMVREADLIAPKGRRESPGRPTLWGTTPHFLAQFGLRDLRELPRREDLLLEPATIAGPVAQEVQSEPGSPLSPG